MDSINNRLLNVNLNLEGQQKQTEKVEQKAAQEQPKTLAELESKFAKGEISAEEMKKQAEELGLKVSVKTNDVEKEIKSICDDLTEVVKAGASFKDLESEIKNILKGKTPEELNAIKEQLEHSEIEPLNPGDPIPDKLFGTILFCAIILTCCYFAITAKD